MDIYGFLLAGSLITMGTLGDRIGRRRLLLIGAAAFGFASMLAAFSTSAEMLIWPARCSVSPARRWRRRPLADPQHVPRPGAAHVRHRRLGTSFSAGAAIGPLVGGVLLQHFWWGSVFLLGVPVMAAAARLGPILLPEFRDPERGPARPLQRGPVARRGAADHLWVKQVAEDGAGWLPALSVAAGSRSAPCSCAGNERWPSR